MPAELRSGQLDPGRVLARLFVIKTAQFGLIERKTHRNARYLELLRFHESAGGSRPAQAGAASARLALRRAGEVPNDKSAEPSRGPVHYFSKVARQPIPPTPGHQEREYIPTPLTEL